MVNADRKTRYWDEIAENAAKRYEFDELLAEQYQRVHLNLIARWADAKGTQRILKTDLFAEGLQPSRAFLWEMLKNNDNIVGIDISNEIASRAKSSATRCAPGSSAEYINCDVRHLPFASNSFDLLISDSTLDHFRHEDEILAALSELSRVLKPGGALVITMDNKGNFTEPLFRLWVFLGLSYFFIGKTYSIKQLKQALAGVGLRVTDTTAIIHNPRFFTRKIIALLHKGNPNRFNRWIRKGLDILDSLEKRDTKYFTAQFIAARAVKPSE
jgi:ubiquinone/menaquinone biosynthesis C-methylase UbiE